MCVEGRISCIYIQGNGASCAPRKWGQGLRGKVPWEAPVFDGGFPRREKGEGDGGGREGGRERESTVPREFPGWCRGGKGVEWNGMELSVVPVGRGGAEGPRGPKIDNAIPRLPLSPSTQLAPALLSFLLLRFSCPLLLLLLLLLLLPSSLGPPATPSRTRTGEF